MIAACAKEQAPETASEDTCISFTATTPECLVKTILGDESQHKSISWAEGDSVSIYYGTTATAFKSVPIEKNGEVKVRVQTSSFKNFFGVYPFWIQAQMKSTSAFSIKIPSSQSGKFEDANIMAAYADGERLLRFKSAASLIAVDIKSNDVTGIIVRANDGTPISGETILSFDNESGEISHTEYTDNVCEEVSVSVQGAGRYYIALLPNVNLKAGLGFRIIRNDGSEGVLSRTAAELKSSEIRIIGEIEDKVLPTGDIFIKEGGSGNGSSWSDAGGIELLDKLVNLRVSKDVMFDGVTTAWRLGSRKIFIAKGNYELGADSIPFSLSPGNSSLEIVGGFYEGSTGTDVSQYDPKANPTVLTSSADVRIAEIFGKTGSRLTLKGLTFRDASTKTNGAALYVNAPGSTLNLTDCIFAQNSTTASGAGIYLSEGNVHLSGCSFEQNMATSTVASATTESDAYLYQTSRGGAIFAQGNKSEIFIENCEFRSNLAFVGADIELQTGAKAFAYRSRFIGGVAMAGNHFKNYPGRSINADAMPAGETGSFCACNCTFTKTSSTYTSNGGLPIIAPSNYFCMLVSCTFHDGAVASVRNNNLSDRTTLNPDLIWLISNLFVNSTGNAVNLGSSSNRHGFYNIMEKGKNAYSDLDATDSKIAEQDFTTMKFNSDEGFYSWTINETAHPVQKPTRAFVSETVKKNCPEFDTWLNSLCDNPYGVDQLGTARNPGAMYPGAWDKGL